MAEAAAKFEQVRDTPFMRRFERPDIDKHVDWLFPRLMKLFPHFYEARNVTTFILNILPSSEFIFLYQDHAVALAQISRLGINPEPIIEEVFVLIDEPDNEDKQKDAAYFYEQFAEIAKHKNLSTVLVEQNTDVPRKMIADITGKRVFETKQAFLRVR